jgi:hypothetical protein
MPGTTSAILAIADRLTPAVRRQFLAAVQTLQNRISLAALTRAIEKGELTLEITEALGAWPVAMRQAAKTLQQAFAAAGLATGRALAKDLRLKTSFTLVNPSAVAAADVGTALLVRKSAPRRAARYR